MKSTCKKILCDQNPPITSNHQFKKWALKNHPDKVSTNIEEAKERFQEVSGCRDLIKDSSITCDSDTPKPKKTNENVPSKQNNHVNLKKSTCIRTTENWTYIDKTHRFDKATFNPTSVLNDLPTISPKCVEMIAKIREIDDRDMKKHNKLFKHFIFSDVKDGGYGAKVIASALIANGFNSCFKANQYNKIDLQIPQSNVKKETFGLLCSTAMFNSSYTKMNIKYMLNTYNARPENIQGDNMRFIIFDSGFKEGIDLFDVRYVHIFENQQNTADLTQAVGRATRSCGQKGLNFIPNKGWVLDVYQYYSIYSKPISSWGDKMDSWYDSKNDTNRVFDKYLYYKGVDLNKIVFKENLEKIAILSSIDYDLNYNINKFEENVNDDILDMLEIAYTPLKGGAQNYKLYGCINGKCGSRSTKTIPFSLKVMEYLFIKRKGKLPSNYKSMLSKDKRMFFCTQLKENNEYCTNVNAFFHENKNKIPKTYKPHNNKTTTQQPIVVKPKTSTKQELQIVKNNTSKQITSVKEEQLALELVKQQNKDSVDKYLSNIDMKSDIPDDDYEKMSFNEFQSKINKIFKKYKYAPITITNNCVDNINNQDDKDKDSRLVDFTESQEFISRYFTPKIDQKGMLIWHSVGTGKTCTALATKSYLFEKQNYSILWVTRSTLKDDIWKNMFEKVCDYVIRDKIKSGVNIPIDPVKIRQYVYKKFMPPMSYKQFSNTLAKKNEFSKKLIDVNGDEDMLKNTLIIVDEAHKLYSKDLIALEKPNMSVIENAVHNSYNMSGKQSCKVMLMTATPIADDPMEFFKLTNLLIHDENKLFPINYSEFSNKYIDTNTNNFTSNGKKQFQNNIKGLVSYLNRRFDPRQFTQPVFHEIPVLISQIPRGLDLDNCLNASKNTLETCLDNNNSDNLKTVYDKKLKDLNEELSSLKNKLQNNKKDVSTIKKELKNKKLTVSQKDNLNLQLSDSMKELEIFKQRDSMIKDDIKELKNEYKQNTRNAKSEIGKCKKTFTDERKMCKSQAEKNSKLYQDITLMKC